MIKVLFPLYILHLCSANSLSSIFGRDAPRVSNVRNCILASWWIGMQDAMWRRLSGPWRGPLMANSIVTNRSYDGNPPSVHPHTHTHHLNRFFFKWLGSTKHKNRIQQFTFMYGFFQACEWKCVTVFCNEFQQCSNRNKKSGNLGQEKWEMWLDDDLVDRYHFPISNSCKNINIRIHLSMACNRCERSAKCNGCARTMVTKN